jgi:hypothetical protein
VAKKKLAVLPIVLVCTLFLLGSTLASNSTVIRRSVVSAGGEQVTDGSLYILNGTLGEPIAGAIVLEASLGLGSGFWWPRESEINVYLPVVLRDYP